MFLGLFSLALSYTANVETPEPPKLAETQSVLCKATCTQRFAFNGGEVVEATASAGGPFTSCKTAIKKACAKAAGMIIHGE